MPSPQNSQVCSTEETSLAVSQFPSRPVAREECRQLLENLSSGGVIDVSSFITRIQALEEPQFLALVPEIDRIYSRHNSALAQDFQQDFLRVLYSLAEHAELLSQYELSERWFDRLLPLAQGHESSELYGLVAQGVGVALSRLGFEDDARAKFALARTAFEKSAEVPGLVSFPTYLYLLHEASKLEGLQFGSPSAVAEAIALSEVTQRMVSHPMYQTAEARGDSRLVSLLIAMAELHQAIERGGGELEVSSIQLRKAVVSFAAFSADEVQFAKALHNLGTQIVEEDRHEALAQLVQALLLVDVAPGRDAMVLRNRVVRAIHAVSLFMREEAKADWWKNED